MADDSENSGRKNNTYMGESNKILSEIIDFLPDAALAINANGEVIVWNKAMEKLTGVNAEDILGKGNYEHALPFYGVRRPILADLVLMPETQLMESYSKIQRDGKTITAEIFIPTFGPKGSFIWAKATPLYDSLGKIIGAIESIRDITERKKSEEALLKSEQEKAAILGGLKNVAVEYLDPEMRIIWLNDAVQKTVQKKFGLSAEDVKDKYCFKLIQGLDSPCPGCTAIKAIQTRQSQEGELLTPDGKAWVSRSSPIKDSEGHVKGVVHVAVNITQRKRAEEKLANIIDFLPDATFVMDINSKVIAWNRALEELTGVKAEQMIGKGDYEYALPFYGSRRPMLIDLAMMPDTDVCGKYSNLQREGNTLITEVYIPTFGQGGANLWAKATPLYDAAGKLMGAIESVRDMTQLRRAEKTLERSKAELRIASDIQRSFLPEHIPPIPGFDMAAISIPAMEVGGDFYDFIPGNGSVGMVIADVSGKSIPAALFMALSRTIVRANATHHERGTDVLQEANDMISADSHSGMFVTLFYGVIDQSTLTYANAGHPPPVLLRKGSDDAINLDVTGIALGAVSGVEYEERKIALSHGDIVILYTDGVTEAININVEQYSLKRLCAVAQRYRHLSAQGILEKILEDISHFSGDQAQFDDITMIIVKAE
ncbi:MAG: SpoIIE family protein phosphatase [Methanotrichaceae archaeon]